DEYGEGYGSFFEFDTSTKIFNVKKQIIQAEGIGPTKMIKAPDGNFYGTFPWAGTNWVGSIYKYNPVTDSFSIIHTFSGLDGSYPEAKLILANDGFLYGTTTRGGSMDAGTIYKIDVWNNTFTKLQDVVSTSLIYPLSSLYQASNGKMYGTTKHGIYGFGALYEYDVSMNTINSLVDFDSTNYGASPSGAVIELSNGLLGGTTSLGGNHGFGVIYQYNILLDSMIIVHHFDSTVNGASDELLDAGNNKFMGVSYGGGNYNQGVLYEYDKQTSTVSIQQHFKDSIGASPWIVPIRILDITNILQTHCQLKMFLQGYYEGASMMKSVLQNQGVAVNSALTDTVTIELHDTIAPFGIAYSFTGILATNGIVMCSFPVACNGHSYNVVVRQRNSLETWSAAPLLMSEGAAFDFSTAASQAYGNNQIEIEPGVFAIYSGDLNQDGFIDSFDFPALDTDIFNGVNGVYVNTDLNGDGFVDSFDFPVFDANSYNGVSAMMP
nr:hypothetical protein [Chitinophagaceae bacterium]